MNKIIRLVCLTALLTLNLLFVVALSAQDTLPAPEDQSGVTVRPVTDIIDGELTVTNFAADGTATLPITTSVPVACSIIYGTTPEFGSLAVDMDMNGGAHTDHQPLLSGLEPETTYYFRVQGVDAGGVIYVSDVQTFTTPAQQIAEVTNLASPELGAEIIGYSSAFGGAAPEFAWGILSAFDGSSNSAWSSQGDGSNAWFEIRLGQRSHIERIEYWTRTMSNNTAQVFSFTITADDGTVYGPFDVPDANQSFAYEVDFEAETLRFEVVESNGGNTGAVEFGVYGTPLGE